MAKKKGPTRTAGQKGNSDKSKPKRDKRIGGKTKAGSRNSKGGGR